MHVNLLAVLEKSRSEKEKSGLVFLVSHALFVSAQRTRRWFIASHSLTVSCAPAAWGGAAAPVMEEPGLRGVDGEATGDLEGTIQNHRVIGSQVRAALRMVDFSSRRVISSSPDYS